MLVWQLQGFLRQMHYQNRRQSWSNQSHHTLTLTPIHHMSCHSFQTWLKDTLKEFGYSKSLYIQNYTNLTYDPPLLLYLLTYYVV